MDGGESERKMLPQRSKPEGRMRRAVGAVVLGAGLSLGAAAGAQTLSVEDPSYLALGLGAFDVQRDTAAEGRLEYRSSTKLLGFLKPVFGGIVTSKGGAYGYGGFMTDIYFGDHWVLSPTAAVGLYEKGDGSNLGSWVEFKTGFEVAYRFGDRSRLGVSFHHISNASLAERNPGEESLELVWSIPFGLLK
jgi:hypothetical protein